jgi:hypothetical protein
MAKIRIKTDFVDGNKLFAAQLNNNFKTIQEAWESENTIVWQGDNNESVQMFRGTTEEVKNRDIENGQILWNVETGETFLDTDDKRVNTGSGTVVAIQEEEPDNEATKLWINPEEINPFLDYLYPVGSIYLSIDEINPSLKFGGAWEQIKDKFLLGAGDTYTAGTTGGSATHTLTVDEMPSHQHKLLNYNTGGGASSFTNNSVNAEGNTGYASNVRTDFSGGGQPHNNMPPYLTVYMWKRIG